MTAARGIFSATVTANAMICREHFRLTLAIPAFPPTDPGQFVQVWCRSDDPGDRELEWAPGERPTIDRPDLLGPAANLRRPFSLAGRRDFDGRSEIDVIHRIVGVGTDWLSKLRPGELVSVLGPLGNRFDLPPDAFTLLVGGGVGIPPMMYLASRLGGRRAVAFVGALTRDLLAVTIPSNASDPARPPREAEEFARYGVPTIFATDDGSYGMRGFVTTALEQFLDDVCTRPVHTANLIICTCGPEPMMHRVASIAAARGIRCQVAVERAMACGMGTCQSCCIKIKKRDPAAVPMPGSSWAWRLACTDGPVFDADRIVG